VSIIRRWPSCPPKGWPPAWTSRGGCEGAIIRGWGQGRGQRGRWTPARKRKHGVCEISIIVLLPIHTHDVQIINVIDVTWVV
jgi:hypothetical protein